MGAPLPTSTIWVYSLCLKKKTKWIFNSSKEVLREYANIDNGIGTPSLSLAMGLLFAWLVIVLVLIKGIHSSGKASYFLALFPYVIMGILLIRAVTLPGSMNGILYFIRPQWDKILEPKVSKRMEQFELFSVWLSILRKTRISFWNEISFDVHCYKRKRVTNNHYY